MVRGLLAAGIGSPGFDRDRDPLESLATSAREQGKAAEVLAVQTDLTSDTAADEITRATRARFGRIDILVNNAGIGPGAIRPDSWQRPLKFWEVTPRSEHCRARDDAPGLGPDRQCHDQPWHDAGRWLSDLRPVQGRARGAERDYGKGPRWHRSDRQRS